MRLSLTMLAVGLAAACSPMSTDKAAAPAEPATAAAPIAPPPGPSAALTPTIMECEHDTKLSVAFDDSDQVRVRVLPDGSELVLRAEPAASGYVYGDGGRHTLAGKGREATWTVGRMVPIRCVEQGAPKTW